MKIENGTILEIPLDKEFGFAYSRYLDISSSINREFGSDLLMVYSNTSLNSINDINDIIKSELLFAPVLIDGKPSIKGKNKWRIIGNYIDKSDDFIPDFKSARCFPYIVEDESKIGPWNLVKLGIDEIETDYHKIKHLEQNSMHSEDQIVARIIMELLRTKGIKIEDYFNFSKEEEHIKRTYFKMKNVPIYSKVPKEIRGRINKKNIKIL
ncbi:MAG: immunity 26/phosphotriesterase HocA family protein [Bacteroidales bacterium]|nr:immunity 26/phosphotriesterase HocA family protein [Bacteroidales bacterium]